MRAGCGPHLSRPVASPWRSACCRRRAGCDSLASPDVDVAAASAVVVDAVAWVRGHGAAELGNPVRPRDIGPRGSCGRPRSAVQRDRRTVDHRGMATACDGATKGFRVCDVSRALDR